MTTMFLTTLRTKSTFLGSLLNKYRQVVKKTQNTTTNNTNHNFSPETNDNIPVNPTTNSTQNANENKNTNRTNLLNATAAATTSPVSKNNVNTTSAIKQISTTTINFKTIEEKLGLPIRPKRPITPYFRYMRDMRTKMFAENPKLSTQEIVRLMSKQWPTVDQKIKERLEEEYKREHEIYIEQRIKYDANLTPKQRADISQLKQEAHETKERRRQRQRVKALGRPKRPASAFIRFLQVERISTPQLPQQTFREWHKKCVAKWARLTDAEKESYFNESRAEFEIYKKKLAEWEENMMRLGNIDVVRNFNLIDPPEPKPKKSQTSPKKSL